jgi:hypothetical protein
VVTSDGGGRPAGGGRPTSYPPCLTRSGEGLGLRGRPSSLWGRGSECEAKGRLFGVVAVGESIGAPRTRTGRDGPLWTLARESTDRAVRERSSWACSLCGCRGARWLGPSTARGSRLKHLQNEQLAGARATACATRSYCVSVRCVVASCVCCARAGRDLRQSVSACAVCPCAVRAAVPASGRRGATSAGTSGDESLHRARGLVSALTTHPGRKTVINSVFRRK